MEEPSVKLTRRSGTDDYGKAYEVKVMALMALRCVENSKIKQAWFASNEDNAYDLDDVIVHVKDAEKRSVAYLMQLKHQDHAKNIPRKDFLYNAEIKKKKNMTEDFSLHKYQRSYVQIKENLRGAVKEGEFNASLRDADEINYVLYTNRTVGVVHDFLEVCEDANFLNTADGAGNVYGFKRELLDFGEDFLRHTKLYSGQVHFTNVDKLMKTELRRVADAVEINAVDLNSLLKKYLDFVQTFAKCVRSDNFYALTKDDVTAQLMSFLLDEHKVKFPLNRQSLPEFSVWSEITEGKGLVVVEATDFTGEFLKSYVSAKVAEHCALNNWNQELSKESFYKKAPDLKAVLVKIVGSGGLTPTKVYEALWLLKKVPLLVEAKNSKDFKKVKAALRLTRHRNYTVVVLTSCDTSVSAGCFSDISHLSEDHRSLVLGYPITVQGRPGARLGDVTNKSMHKLIKCKDVIDVISNRFNAGTVQGTVLQFYVPRAVSKVLFRARALRPIDAKFRIRGIDRTRFQEMSKEYVETKRKKSTETFDDDPVPKKMSKDYHELRIVDEDFFELTCSYSCTRRLREHQLLNPKTLEGYLSGWRRAHEIESLWTSPEDLYASSPCVINANPGMGKTELLGYVAANAPIDFWVLKVDLNKHHDYYKTLVGPDKTASDHLKYFANSSDELTEKVFSKYASLKKVMVLLDGFDEIATTYTEEVTSIATSLHAAGFKVWVTTRPVTKAHLEEALDTVSRTLKPLVIENQKTFLIRYFGRLAHGADQTRTVSAFVEKLLVAASANLKDRDNQFTGLPLQMKLLADVFEDDLKKALSTNVLAFEDNFDLLYLYERFLEEKRKIFCEKFGEIYRDMSKFIEKVQQLFALQEVFPAYMLRELRVEEKLEEYYEDDDRMLHFLQREGVVVIKRRSTNSEDKFDANFVHKTFAEYLSAKWLYRNYKKEEVQDLIAHRFYGLHDFLFGVFDRYLAKGHPLHLSIIHRDKGEALELIGSDLSCASLLDGGRRSFLHMIACYGVRHPLDCHSEKEFRDEMADVIDAVPEAAITDAEDDVLRYNPLEYAILSESLAVADKLCQKSKEFSFSVDIAEKDAIFFYCDRCQYKDLFLFLLKIFARRDLLGKQVEPDQTLQEYCSYPNLTGYTREFDCETLMDLVRKICVNDVGFVAAFGTESDLRVLLDEGVDPNRTDRDFNTALHYASVHDRLENAKLLMSRHANVNAIGAHGNTALHLAVDNGSEEVIKLLLSSRIDLNCQNNEEQTALHNALYGNAFDVASVLIDRGADVNLKCDLGMTPLFAACEFGQLDLVEKILPKVTDLNARTLDEQLALHAAITTEPSNYETRLGIVRLLVERGIDVNSQDKYGTSALHSICNVNTKRLQYLKDNCLDDEVTDEAIDRFKTFHKSAALIILNGERVRLDLKNDNDETPLDVALANEDIDWEVLATLKTKSALPNCNNELH